MATHASPQLGGARCDKTLAGLLSNDYSVLWISMQNGGINLAILLQLHAILVDQNLINFFLSLSLSLSLGMFGMVKGIFSFILNMWDIL